VRGTAARACRRYSSQRKLIKRGAAGKHNRRGAIQQLELFLFTDVLVCVAFACVIHPL
jgi:hypothetical protein